MATREELLQNGGRIIKPTGFSREELLGSGGKVLSEPRKRLEELQRIQQENIRNSPGIGTLLPFTPKETSQDIRETVSGLGGAIKDTRSRFKNIYEANRQRQQTPLESGFQYAGTALGGAFNLALQGGIGAAKTALPQTAEDLIGRGFQAGLGKVAGLEPVQKGIETFESFSPRTQRNISAGFEIASTLPIAAGVKLLPKGIKVLEKAGDVTKSAAGRVLEPVSDFVAKRQSDLFVKVVDDLEQTYTDIFSGTTIGKKKVGKIQTKTANLNKAGTTGVTPQRVLAEAGVVPKISGTKLNTFEQAQEFRSTIRPLQDANRQALAEIDTLGVKYDIDQLKNLAIKEAKTTANINSGKFESMQKNILREYGALKRQYPNGISLQQVDDIKSARWANVFENKSLIDADVLKKNSDYAIAKSLQRHIEDVSIKSGNPKVAQLNREIGSRLDASKFLEDLDGKVLKGGRLLKYVSTLIGSSLGQSALGKLAGAIGGNLIGNIIISSQVSNPIKRAILKMLKERDPKAYIETVAWLARQSNARKNRLLLPAGDKKAIELFDGIQKDAGGKTVQNSAQLLPAQKGPVGIDPKTGRFMKTFTQETTQSKSPTSQQTTPAIKTDAKTANIPTQSNIPAKKSTGVINTIKKKIKETPNKKGGFIKLPQGKGEQSVSQAKSSLPKNTKETFIGEVPAGYKPAPLTTKLLKKLEGKTTVSKQFISDLTNSPDLKQVEKELIRAKLEGKGNTINVADFGKEVEADLLPLEARNQPKTVAQARGELKKMGYTIEKEMDGGASVIDNNGNYVEYDELPESTQKLIDRVFGNAETYDEVGGYKYESISLPDNLRGNIKNYKENIYESPIKTSAGNVHFPQSQNYFGHTRIEDMADNSTRRVIEVQSDLFQKGNLERELDSNDFERLREATNHEKAGNIKTAKKIRDEVKVRQDELSKLQQYNNPTAHFRMIREEIQKASKDGKTKLQLPTGETAMKIEGLGDAQRFSIMDSSGIRRGNESLTIENMKVGTEVYPTVEAGDNWIITDVLGDGKFKAVPKDNMDFLSEELAELGVMSPDDLGPAIARGDRRVVDLMNDGQMAEQFDISGKVDTNNPIYKFYDKEVQKYLKNNYDAKPVTDAQGVTWFEVPVKKEYKNMPIEAFGIIGALGGATLINE